MPMTVRRLINALKKMPQNAVVGYSHPDNEEHEIAGWCCGVEPYDQEFHASDPSLSDEDKMLVASHAGKKIVVIRG